MARKKNKPRRLLSVTSVEHVRPTAPPEPARPTSRPSSLLPQAQETTPGAVTALIASSSPPSSTHQERLPANPLLDLLALSSAVVSQCGQQEATQPPTKRSPAAPPPPDAAPVQWPAEFNSSQGEDCVIRIHCAPFARLMAAAGLGDEDAVKVLERSMPLQRFTIKKMQRMAKKRKERKALRGEVVSKDIRSFEEIFRAVKECVGENGGSTESGDGSSCRGEVSGDTGGNRGDGGDGGDTCDDVAWVKRAWIRLVLALLSIFVVLVAWVVRSWFQV